MRLTRWRILLPAFILVAGLGTAASIEAAPAAHANAVAAICNYPSGSLCMNDRDGDDPGVVQGWPAEFTDGYESFEGLVATDRCSDGTVSTTCPFTVGSGLNDRYEGDYIIYIEETNNGGCIGESGEEYAILETGCIPTGGLFVISDTNGAFLIDVQVSDYWYGEGDGGDNPYWLITNGQGGQLLYAPSASNSWGCVSNGGGCGAA